MPVTGCSFSGIRVQMKKCRMRIANWILANQRGERTFDPFRLIHVDPETVELFHTGEIEKPSWQSTVKSGDWDKNVSSFSDHFVFESMFERFIDGVSWEQTEYYQWHVERIESSIDVMSGTNMTVSEFEKRCERIDKLYHLFQEYGYATQYELRHNPQLNPFRESAGRFGADRSDIPVLNEVSVYIDRDGQFILPGGGKHRTALAIISDIDYIPVRVEVRHKKWQKQKEYGEIESHPDVPRS